MEKIDLGSWVQIGILIVMSAGLGFTIGYNLRSERISSLETQINAYEFAKITNLNDLLKSLHKASEQLSNDLVLSNKNNQLNSELATTNELNKKLIEDINILKERNEYLDSILSDTYGETDKFTLESEVTKYLFENKIIIAWDRSSFISGIDLKINNISKHLNIGDSYPFKVNDENYKIVFDSYGENSNEAIFVYSK